MHTFNLSIQEAQISEFEASQSYIVKPYSKKCSQVLSFLKWVWKGELWFVVPGYFLSVEKEQGIHYCKISEWGCWTHTPLLGVYTHPGGTDCTCTSHFCSDTWTSPHCECCLCSWAWVHNWDVGLLLKMAALTHSASISLAWLEWPQSLGRPGGCAHGAGGRQMSSRLLDSYRWFYKSCF